VAHLILLICTTTLLHCLLADDVGSGVLLDWSKEGAHREDEVEGAQE
jgi:hypothetical protein